MTETCQARQLNTNRVALPCALSPLPGFLLRPAFSLAVVLNPSGLTMAGRSWRQVRRGSEERLPQCNASPKDTSRPQQYCKRRNTR